MPGCTVVLARATVARCRLAVRTAAPGFQVGSARRSETVALHGPQGIELCELAVFSPGTLCPCAGLGCV
jgi:hypothetical protein